MAEPTPPPVPTSESRRPSQPATPPPGSVRRSSGPPDPFGGIDRVARLQTIAAIVLGLVLIAIPLYLWRRPRSDSPPVTSASDASAALASTSADGGAPGAVIPPPALPPGVTLSESKVMECHDQGSKRTRAEDCDHLVTVEKGFAAAITSAGACVPASAGGGNLVYVLDASFGRKRKPLDLYVPRDGRGLKNAHATAAAVKECTAAVKRALLGGAAGASLDGVPHQHQRYKVAITATYAGTSTP